MAIRTTTKPQTFRDYVDIDFNFSRHPVKKDISLKIGDAAINQAIKTIVLLAFYEKPFQPHIGCGARQLLFEQITPSTALLLRDVITQALENFEPRVTQYRVDVVGNPDENRYEATIAYFGINRTEPTVTTIFLERVR